MALPPNFDTNNPVCPVCKGKVWDNRESKRNPKAPDFKCRDKSCGGAVWLDKADKQPAPQSKPAQSVSQQAAATRTWERNGYRGPALSRDEFWQLQRDFFVTALAMVHQSAGDAKLGLSDFEIVSLAQDFTAQAMIGIERNVLVLESSRHEQPVQPAAQTETSLSKAAAGYVETLKIMATDTDCDSVREMFMQDVGVKPEERQGLLKAWMDRKREIATIG